MCPSFLPLPARPDGGPASGKHLLLFISHNKGDWFQAIRTGSLPCMDIELGHRAATLCILGNLSYLLGRVLHWDGAQERIIGDAQATRLLSRPQRDPYVL